MQVLSDCHQASEGGNNGTRRIYEKIVRKKCSLSSSNRHGLPIHSFAAVPRKALFLDPSTVQLWGVDVQ